MNEINDTPAQNSTPSQESSRSDKVSIGLVIGILAFFFLIFLICMSAVASLVSGDLVAENGIGVVEIKGAIESADQTVRTIQDFSDDEQIQAILIRIDSPGGSVSASQEMVEAIKSIEKPVVISMGDMAASGGYYVACAGPKIFANPGTLTGSIGVISQVMEFKDLMEIIKVKVHTVKTGDLKDSGSPYREFNETDNAYFTALGLEILDQFVTHVSESRQIPKDKVTQLADGRVWTGREAKSLGLIDELGGMQAAIAELKTQAGLTGKHTLIYPKKDTDAILSSLLKDGVTGVADSVRTTAQQTIQSPESFKFLYVGH
ncbi:MAG: signal peptide peptidase SppA [Proteobacteria bacterium]|nr:signal peptide peptidase SppA [Pseudomonadota bacterium]